jgi:hypothetical protein
VPSAVAVALLLAATPRPASRATVPSVPAPPISDPTADSAIETWPVAPDALPPAPAPRARVAAPAPAAEVDWTALSRGAAEVEIAPDAPRAKPAELTIPLSAEEARAILADAESYASGTAVPRGVGVVIGRGTPPGGSDGGICRFMGPAAKRPRA